MSGSVTPARRRREDDDDDDGEGVEWDGPVSIDGSPRSSGSKRARLNIEEDGGVEDEGSESVEGDVLPESFRRSPRGKNRAVDGLSNAREAQKHQPGSIVRVTLTNFVTYTKAEFHPGPNLNMIIGPNGTGKSTLVCAICLGLGWATSHLGRAKDLGEFVKHGAKRAEVEIELAADPERHRENQVITTRITKDGNKAEYMINAKKSNKKGVQELARSFSIQVDNLCQFLPQDRVVEFAALSSVDLLIHTQRAAAPEYMSQWHDELKTLRKDQRQSKIDQQKEVETLKNMENRHRLQEADVVRLRERAQLQERIATLEKLRPFPDYQVAKTKHKEAKDRRKTAEGELKALERRLEPNLKAVENKSYYTERVHKILGSRQRFVDRHGEVVADIKKKIESKQEEIDGCAQEIQAEKNSTKGTRQGIARLEMEIKNIEKAMETPPEAFDPAEMNEQIREKTRQIREIVSRAEEIRTEVGSLNQQGRTRQERITQANAERDNMQSQAGQQANKLKTASRDAATAWEWIQKNRDRFQSEVFGPPIVECTVKDPSHASAVESVIQESEQIAVTVTSQADFRMLQQQLYGEMNLSKINIRTSTQPLSAFRPPMPDEDLRRFGLEQWILDLMEGPDAVLAMLCDNRNIHQTAFTTRDISGDHFGALQRSPISSWVTLSHTYMITRRREYGDKATSTRVQPLRQAKFFTDMPVDRQMQQEIDARITEARGEIAHIKEEITLLQTEGSGLNEQRRQLEGEKKEIEGEKGRRQRSLAEFNGLPAKLSRSQDKLRDAQEKVKGSKERQREIVGRGDKLCMEKGQCTLDYANAVEVLRGLHIQLFEAEILHIEAMSDLERLKAQHAGEELLIEERRTEVAKLKQVATDLLNVGKNLQMVCQRLGEDLSNSEQEIFNEIEGWKPEQLETEVLSMQARLEMTHGGGNDNTIRDYERRAVEIERRRAHLNELDAELERVTTQIADVRARWEPELDELIAQISEAFADNFSRIQCAGEVAVRKDEEFEQWAIQIRVKFRENEQLSVLDSHRQSGGERAVSTIFYLMALQSLARAPFRVVDEINQGMDPRNERLVHARMVDIACGSSAENGSQTSQYFLITPKLLNGLKYHPRMKVHCIASGEYMPSDHRELDFGVLAKKALAVRGGAVRVAG